MNDYGHIDDGTLSLAISVKKEYGRKGIGTKLLREFLNLLRLSGYKKVSLSVQKENYAVKMYMRLGFKIFSENNSEYIMLRKF